MSNTLKLVQLGPTRHLSFLNATRHLNNLYTFPLRVLTAKFGWIWSFGCADGVENEKMFKMIDQCWLEKHYCVFNTSVKMLKKSIWYSYNNYDIYFKIFTSPDVLEETHNLPTSSIQSPPGFTIPGPSKHLRNCPFWSSTCIQWFSLSATII